jgi:hypothetical protein
MCFAHVTDVLTHDSAARAAKDVTDKKDVQKQLLAFSEQ